MEDSHYGWAAIRAYETHIYFFAWHPGQAHYGWAAIRAYETRQQRSRRILRYGCAYYGRRAYSGCGFHRS